MRSVYTDLACIIFSNYFNRLDRFITLATRSVIDDTQLAQGQGGQTQAQVAQSYVESDIPWPAFRVDGLYTDALGIHRTFRPLPRASSKALF